MRKRAWALMLLAMGAFLLAGGSGALGQPTEPPAKDYAYRDGKVIIGGDVGVPCRWFDRPEEKRDFFPEAARGEVRAQAERALEQCEQAGHVTLPGTGGGSSALLAAGVLLVCAGLGLVVIHPSARRILGSSEKSVEIHRRFITACKVGWRRRDEAQEEGPSE